MFTQRGLKGLTVASAATLLAVGVAGTASAHVTVVPGDNGDGRTVIVNNPGMDVEVVSVDREAGTAQVTMANNLGFDVYCEAANQDAENRPGGSISTATVVEGSAEYYQRFQNVKAEDVRITMSVLGSTGTMVVDLWPLSQFLPQGSVGANAGEAVALRSQIAEGNTAAKVGGLYGTTPAFRLNNGADITRTVTLGPPSTNPRSDAKVGYFTMCANGTNSAAAQGNAQLYAWSAFEEGWPPAEVDEGDGNTGSLGSGSLGSLGSSGAGGNNGDGNGTDNGGEDGVDNGDGGEETDTGGGGEG
ncbi:hypothetical protein K3888_02255 [Dietzia aurantiaca]|uniref:hypothetical protein n=1 Tax=Dietzia aurantiaca TaxID=983873 RepID=UPI001E4AA439|nr:hypothetical protein [Dietzia aurantiaca]MCD2261514.1 hypothetical protein [Dietzia aurantiaca]